MGKSELLMVLVGIALSIMIALITIPTFTKGGDLAKISLINSDISSIRKVGEMYIQSKSTTGDFTGINAENVSQFIPSLKLIGTGPISYFKSSANENITYNIKPNGTNDKLIVTITGLKVIKDAQNEIKETQSKVGSIDTNDTANGILVISFKG